MKKARDIKKKLVIKKSTVNDLSRKDLNKVKGGATFFYTDNIYCLVCC